MIQGSILALLGAVVATFLRRTRLEETAWKATLVAMLAAPLFAVLPKIDLGFDLPLLGSRTIVDESGAVDEIRDAIRSAARAPRDWFKGGF